MYQQDYDETFPRGNTAFVFPGGTYNGKTGINNWGPAIAPYLKSIGVLACPDDADAGRVDPAWGAGAGIEESYAANGLSSPYTGGPNGCLGVMCQTFNLGGSLPNALVVNDSQVILPDDVIMLTEVHSDDLIRANGGNLSDGNDSANWSNVITGSPFYINPNPPDICETDGGTATSGCTSYPNGVNGAVSATHTGLANFAFVDGHVKAMMPPSTVPDATTNGGANWWDNGLYASRSMWIANHPNQ
jgi:prepilin-type processing-associated H-X9-DG protein